MAKKGSVVLAGSVLGVEEEYSAGKNAFVNDSGEVVSQVIGVAVENPVTRSIDVLSRRRVSPMASGALVEGQIVMVLDAVAIVEVFSAKKDQETFAIPSVTFAVPVSKCDSGFVRRLDEKFKVGDIVRGRVDAVVPWGIDLTTQAPELGVVKAFCGKCREPLYKSASALKCLGCGREESRKLSSQYSL